MKYRGVVLLSQWIIMWKRAANVDIPVRDERMCSILRMVEVRCRGWGLVDSVDRVGVGEGINHSFIEHAGCRHMLQETDNAVHPHESVFHPTTLGISACCGVFAI
jgi:hypothetical protein